jgi:hypothetical protein
MNRGQTASPLSDRRRALRRATHQGLHRPLACDRGRRGRARKFPTHRTCVGRSARRRTRSAVGRQRGCRQRAHPGTESGRLRIASFTEGHPSEVGARHIHRRRPRRRRRARSARGPAVGDGPLGESPAGSPRGGGVAGERVGRRLLSATEGRPRPPTKSVEANWVDPVSPRFARPTLDSLGICPSVRSRRHHRDGGPWRWRSP